MIMAIIHFMNEYFICKYMCEFQRIGLCHCLLLFQCRAVYIAVTQPARMLLVARPTAVRHSVHFGAAAVAAVPGARGRHGEHISGLCVTLAATDRPQGQVLAACVE
jgi:hypothetical protein